MTMKLNPLYELSPAQEAEIRAEIAFEDEYNGLRWEGVDVSSTADECDFCAGLTLDV